MRGVLVWRMVAGAKPAECQGARLSTRWCESRVRASALNLQPERLAT